MTTISHTQEMSHQKGSTQASTTRLQAPPPGSSTMFSSRLPASHMMMPLVSRQTSQVSPSQSSGQASVSAVLQSKPATEEAKALAWLSGMAQGGGQPHADQDVVMADELTRSAPASIKRVRLVEPDEEAASEGDDLSDDEDEASGDVVQLLTAIADISAFNAACLAKLSGVPLPDFDKEHERSK